MPVKQFIILQSYQNFHILILFKGHKVSVRNHEQFLIIEKPISIPRSRKYYIFQKIQNYGEKYGGWNLAFVVWPQKIIEKRVIL